MHDNAPSHIFEIRLMQCKIIHFALSEVTLNYGRVTE